MPVRTSRPLRIVRPPFSPTSHRATELLKLADLFGAVGLHDQAETLRDAHRRHTALIGDASRAADAIAKRRRELEGSIAEGDIDPAKAANELAKMRKDSADAPEVADLTAKAKRRIVTDATRPLYDAGDQLLEQLAEIVHTSVIEILDAAPAAEGIEGDDDLVRATVEQFTAWQAMTAARERIEAAWSLAKQLRTHGYVTRLDRATPHHEEWSYRDPRPLYTGTSRYQHPNRALLNHIEAGAEPTVLTAAQFLELLHTSDHQPEPAA